MVIHKNDGTVERIEIKSLNKITFDFAVSKKDNPKSMQILKRISSVIKSNTLFADISYTVRKTSLVTISAFDLNGRLICTIRNTTEPAGSYRQYWDYTDSRGHKVPNGTYVVHIKLDNTLYSKCLFIIK